MEASSGSLEGAAHVILRGRSERGARRRRLSAAVALALAFETWRSLIREQRLSERDVIEPMLELVAVAALD